MFSQNKFVNNQSETQSQHLESNGPRRVDREMAAAAIRQSEGQLNLEPTAILATENRRSYHSSSEVSETDVSKQAFKSLA